MKPAPWTMRAALDAAEAAAQAWAVVFAKSRVVRCDVPLGFDPDDYSAADYDAVADYLAPYERSAGQAPLTASGLRWRYEGDAVLFRMDRVINAPYDDLVGSTSTTNAAPPRRTSRPSSRKPGSQPGPKK